MWRKYFASYVGKKTLILSPQLRQLLPQAGKLSQLDFLWTVVMIDKSESIFLQGDPKASDPVGIPPEGGSSRVKRKNNNNKKTWTHLNDQKRTTSRVTL